MFIGIVYSQIILKVYLLQQKRGKDVEPTYPPEHAIAILLFHLDLGAESSVFVPVLLRCVYHVLGTSDILCQEF